MSFREPSEASDLDIAKATLEAVNPVGGVEFSGAYPISETHFAVSVELPCDLAYNLTIDSDQLRRNGLRQQRDMQLSRNGRWAYLTAYADARLHFSIGWDSSERSFWGPDLVDIASEPTEA